MERTEVILATGDEHLDQFIKDDLERHGQSKVVATVPTRRSLINKVNEFGPQLIIIGDDLIGDSNSQEESDQEWETVIEEVRRFSYDLRIVFICDRPENDIFLTTLTTYSITDIFHEGKLPEGYIKQILGKPSYNNIIKFRGQVTTVSKSLKEKKREEEEKKAETIIQTGAIPQEGKVVEVEVPVYHQLIVKPKLFVFGSAVKGSGSSTLARMFAEYLVNLQLQVGVLESPFSDPSWYELINAEAITKEDWRSWHELIQDEQDIPKGMSINVEGVTYIVQNPRIPLKKWDLMKSAYLVGYARQIPILIYDISDGITEDKEKLILRQANQIFLSTQFDPARVHSSQKRIISYMNEQNLTDKVTLLCNHSNDYLEKKFNDDLKEAYDNSNPIYHFPHLEEVKMALMDGESVWGSLDEETVEFLHDTFFKMAEAVLGKELLDKLQPMKKKKRPFLSLFKSAK
jgi:hypothetical protein